MINKSSWRLFQKRTNSWSIARRMFWISSLFILTQSLFSLVVSTQLQKYFYWQFLNGILSRQLVSSYNVISDRLDQLSDDQIYECCSAQSYKDWLKGLAFENGKVGLIVGSAGLQTTQGAGYFHESEQLLQDAEDAIASPNRFTIYSLAENDAVAAKAVKLPGGIETGFYVYIQPVYSMPLVQMLMRIKLVSELVLMLVLAIALLVSLRMIFRPVRRIRSELATIELNHLESASLSLDDQPHEFQPLLAEFNKMVDRLQRSSTNQKQFASTISHEFRTPMTVISGFIQSVMNRDESMRTQSRDALSLANREVLRLNRMLSDLLDLSRADNNQLRIRREPFNCTLTCREAIRLCQAAYPENPISFRKIDLNDIWADGDSDRLAQCLGNLIGNAVKYSELNGSVAIDLEVQDNLVLISVIDHGQGIPGNQQARIFERFQRAEGVSLRRGDSSSGLGLSIVKMLMEGMGGHVSIKSQVGVGSSFILTLRHVEPS